MESGQQLYNRRGGNGGRIEAQRPGGPANLADILERVLDKGIVIAGDIQINLLDIELLTIKLRLLVASVERAQEMGINWWESDPSLSRGARDLEQENQALHRRLARLEQLAGLPAPRPGEEVVPRARAEAMARATSVLAEAMAHSILDHAGDQLRGEPARARMRPVDPPSAADRPASSASQPTELVHYVYGVTGAGDAGLERAL